MRDYLIEVPKGMARVDVPPSLDGASVIVLDCVENRRIEISVLREQIDTVLLAHKVKCNKMPGMGAGGLFSTTFSPKASRAQG